MRVLLSIAILLIDIGCATERSNIDWDRVGGAFEDWSDRMSRQRNSSEPNQNQTCTIENNGYGRLISRCYSR